MKRLPMLTAMLAAALLAAPSLASDAETSATAGSSRYQRNGIASATASYDGRLGFSRTDARSGKINLARGVAVGLDKDGLSLSISNAFAGRFGPALATTFNLSIGRDGQVSGSSGIALAQGPIERSATAGGSTTTDRSGSGASAFASGKTDPFGRVYATTHSDEHRPQRVIRVRQPSARVVRYIHR